MILLYLFIWIIIGIILTLKINGNDEVIESEAMFIGCIIFWPIMLMSEFILKLR